MPTYGDLFDYVTSKLGDNLMRECDHTLRHTKQFAKMHGLCSEDLVRIVGEMGGFCDCEVLLNSACDIPHEDVIGKETFKTYVQIATEKGFYCHCHVDGTPVSFSEATAAKEAGREVEMWVPCGKGDPHAMPDVNRAMANVLYPQE